MNSLKLVVLLLTTQIALGKFIASTSLEGFKEDEMRGDGMPKKVELSLLSGKDEKNTDATPKSSPTDITPSTNGTSTVTSASTTTSNTTSSSTSSGSPKSSTLTSTTNGSSTVSSYLSVIGLTSALSLIIHLSSV